MLTIQLIILSLAALAGGFFIADVVDNWHNRKSVKPVKCGCFYCK